MKSHDEVMKSHMKLKYFSTYCQWWKLRRWGGGGGGGRCPQVFLNCWLRHAFVSKSCHLSANLLVSMGISHIPV